MAAPIYLTPQYITLDMVVNQLGKSGVALTESTDPRAPGMYTGLANDLLAKGEAYILKTILADYVNIPLQTIRFTGSPTQSDFDTLANDPQYGSTYSEIRDLFISSGLWQIFRQYYSESGSNNGIMLIKAQANKITIYKNELQRVSLSRNLMVRNAFAGLKLAPNALKRFPGKAGQPYGIPTGSDQSWAAFNAVPNYRKGFDR